MSLFQKMKDSANNGVLFIDQAIGPVLIGAGIIGLFSPFAKGYISNSFTQSNPVLMVGASIVSILIGVLWMRFVTNNKKKSS